MVAVNAIHLRQTQACLRRDRKHRLEFDPAVVGGVDRLAHDRPDVKPVTQVAPDRRRRGRRVDVPARGEIPPALRLQRRHLHDAIVDERAGQRAHAFKRGRAVARGDDVRSSQTARDLVAQITLQRHLVIGPAHHTGHNRTRSDVVQHKRRKPRVDRHRDRIDRTQRTDHRAARSRVFARIADAVDEARVSGRGHVIRRLNAQDARRRARAHARVFVDADLQRHLLARVGGVAVGVEVGQRAGRGRADHAARGVALNADQLQRRAVADHAEHITKRVARVGRRHRRQPAVEQIAFVGQFVDPRHGDLPAAHDRHQPADGRTDGVDRARAVVGDRTDLRHARPARRDRADARERLIERAVGNRPVRVARHAIEIEPRARRADQHIEVAVGRLDQVVHRQRAVGEGAADGLGRVGVVAVGAHRKQLARRIGREAVGVGDEVARAVGHEAQRNERRVGHGERKQLTRTVRPRDQRKARRAVLREADGGDGAVEILPDRAQARDVGLKLRGENRQQLFGVVACDVAEIEPGQARDRRVENRVGDGDRVRRPARDRVDHRELIARDRQPVDADPVDVDADDPARHVDGQALHIIEVLRQQPVRKAGLAAEELEEASRRRHAGSDRAGRHRPELLAQRAGDERDILFIVDVVADVGGLKAHQHRTAPARRVDGDQLIFLRVAHLERTGAARRDHRALRRRIVFGVIRVVGRDRADDDLGVVVRLHDIEREKVGPRIPRPIIDQHDVVAGDIHPHQHAQLPGEGVEAVGVEGDVADVAARDRVGRVIGVGQNAQILSRPVGTVDPQQLPRLARIHLRLGRPRHVAHDLDTRDVVDVFARQRDPNRVVADRRVAEVDRPQLARIVVAVAGRAVGQQRRSLRAGLIPRDARHAEDAADVAGKRHHRCFDYVACARADRHRKQLLNRVGPHDEIQPPVDRVERGRRHVGDLFGVGDQAPLGRRDRRRQRRHHLHLVRILRKPQHLDHRRHAGARAGHHVKAIHIADPVRRQRLNADVFVVRLRVVEERPARVDVVDDGDVVDGLAAVGATQAAQHVRARAADRRAVEPPRDVRDLHQVVARRRRADRLDHHVAAQRDADCRVVRLDEFEDVAPDQRRHQATGLERLNAGRTRNRRHRPHQRVACCPATRAARPISTRATPALAARRPVQSQRMTTKRAGRFHAVKPDRPTRLGHAGLLHNPRPPCRRRATNDRRWRYVLFTTGFRDRPDGPPAPHVDSTP